MPFFDKVLFEGDTEIEHYQVVDMLYEGRRARVLFSGNRRAAQSGIPDDDKPEMLFDYNQRFYELVCGVRPKRLLLIGGGVYTLPMKLLEALPRIRIDVVELDAGLDPIAEEFFGYKPNRRLRIFHQDGRRFLDQNIDPYDMILVDAFTHAELPRSLATLQASNQLRRNLHTDGIAALNVIATYKGQRSIPLREQVASYGAVFDSVEIFPADSSFSEWQSQNFIVVGRKNAVTPLHYLRFSAKQLIEVNSKEALLDEISLN